jgi:hypothetical protein
MQPDRDQIEMFVDGLFRHASLQGFVSLRAFYEEDASRPFRINPTALSGGLKFIVEAAEDDANRAANFPKPIVFCPPIATFTKKDRAREIDIAEGLAVSVECDARPHQAREKLEALLGPATIVVRSGGRWTDPATGEVHDKLHLHWRLNAPAAGEALKALKQARDLAARLVGGDPSNKPVCHPIRWPGSWHRKGEPVMCTIDTASPDCEIDLTDALGKLTAACPDEPKQRANGKDHSAEGADWAARVANILSGDNYHDALVRLAAKMLTAGMSDGAAVNLLRAIMSSSTTPRDARWEARYADIPRAVSTARKKFGAASDEAQSAPGAILESTRASTIEIAAIQWLWPDRFAIGKLGLLVGLPDEGKGQVLAHIAARVTRGDEWPCDEGRAPQGNVILLSAEDDARDTVVPRLLAAGADLERIEIVSMIRDTSKRRMFSLVTDLPLLRQKITEVGNVNLVLIDPVSAYLGVGKIDSFRGTDVRAVLGPLVELAAELKVAVIGVLHFNKKIDVTNALLRISDSLAFGAAARHCFAVVDDPENKRKLVVRAKNNLANRNLGALAFCFGVREVGTDSKTGESIRAPHVLWAAHHVDVTASEAMQAANGGKGPAARDEAKEFLENLLRSGPVPSETIEEAAQAEGISRRTLFRAKKELGVAAVKDPDDGKWRWELRPKRASVSN